MRRDIQWVKGLEFVTFLTTIFLTNGHICTERIERNLLHMKCLSGMQTGELWWARDTADHGVIRSTIDGTGDDYPLSGIDHSSRVIKYVVLRSDRYSDHAMPDMRVHDITLIADLNAHDPTVVNPCDVVYDGTTDGSIPESTIYEIESQNFFENFFAYVIPYWTLENFWPWLHISTNQPPETEIECSVHISVDLLQNTRYHALSATTEPEKTRTTQQVEQDASDFVDYLFDFIARYAVHSALAFVIGLTGKVIDSLATTIVNPASVAILIAMLVAWLLLVISYFTWLDYHVANGNIHPWGAASSVLFLMIGLFLGPILTGLTSGWSLFMHFMKWYDIGGGVSGLWPKDWCKAAFAVVSMVFKIAILIACLHYFNKFYSMGIQ